ncbi:MAG: SMC-Scp complex subunit ScpB [Clostridia bacterium]|nr:SMC-Scp complex subunit ScpB [Clostridia bacterium]
MLFASGEPVSAERIAEALELDRATAVKVINNFMLRRNADGGGLSVIHVERSYQMVTRKEFAQYIRHVLEVRRNVPLTQPAMEVLAIVAYNQPVTKGYIEQVRGVDCSGVVNSLVEKGLLEECGRMEVPGKPIIYGTTSAFLRCFGLSSLRDLPPTEQAQRAQEELEDKGA